MTRKPASTRILPANTRAVLVLLGVIAVLWFGWNSPVLWPVKILVVLFHELGHALAAWATGGEVIAIELQPNQGGLTTTRGGWRFGVLNAGYLGSMAWGLVLLIAGRSPKSARFATWALVAVLAGATFTWVRPLISFGMLFCLLATGILATLARRGSPTLNQNVLQGLGLFSMLYALWDVRSDVFENAACTSDATALAEMTWIPAPIWGALWLAIGVATLFATRSLWLR